MNKSLPRILATLALLSGCAAQNVPVYLLDGSAEVNLRRVADACEWWGFQCYEAKDPGRALFITATDRCIFDEHEGLGVCGKTTRSKTNPTIWIGDPTVLEHEIGHAFGLGHSDDEDNVMFGTPMDPSDTWASDEQLDEVNRNAQKLARRD